MTHTASTIGPATLRQAAFKESPPATAADTSAVANQDARFPDMFRLLRDDEDMHKPDGDGAASAQEPVAYTPADGQSQVADTLIDTALPIMLNLPALAMAPTPANTGVFAGKNADGSIDTVRATGNGTSASGSPQDAQSFLASPALPPDAEFAFTPKVIRPGLMAINPGANVVPASFVQGAFQSSAVSSGDMVEAQVHQSSMPAAARVASVSDSESTADISQFGNPGATAELAPVSLNAATNIGAQQAGTLKLAGAPSQWQQPLREALGEHLQVQLGRHSEHAVIRLDPPMLGRIEISIRHEAGALQVHMSASNGEVLRQLQGIGDSLRQDLIHRQYNDVAVVVSSSARHAEGDSAGRQRQSDPGREDSDPGRALHEADQDASTYAFLKDSE